MARAESDAQVVTEILNRLEGHPNFVKANRIVDVLSERSGEAADRKKTPQREPGETTRVHLADSSA